jgi:hypothetical protein
MINEMLHRLFIAVAASAGGLIVVKVVIGRLVN